jgi:patatin-like phospholipase
MSEPEDRGDKHLTIADVLAAEYHALRPGSGYGSATDVASLYRKAHGESNPFSALCISGGGIRSATFALGALQGLANRGILDQFDYLSTVSGGGYIGSWLTAWCKRVPGGLKEVMPHLRSDAKPVESGAPDPIAHLRDYNSYLSPRLGALSADQWTLAATILRNLLLNWIVLLPLLMAVLMVPRLYLSLLVVPELLFGDIVLAGSEPNYAAPELDAISGSLFVRYGLPLLSGALFATALFNTLRYLPGIGNEDHTRADYLRGVLVPLVAAVLAYIAFDSLYYLGSSYTAQSSLSGQMLATLVPTALAWLAYLFVGKRPSRMRVLFGPLSLAIFLMAAGTGIAIWATSNFLLWSPNPDTAMSWPEYLTLAPPAILLGYVLGTVLFVGLSSRSLKDEDREWMSRNVAGLLMFCAVWLVACGTVLIAPKWVADWEAWTPKVLAAAGALSAWASAFGSALVSNNAPRGAAKPGKAWAAAALAIKAAPAIFIIALAIALALATNILLYALHLLPGIGELPEMRLLAVGGAQIPWQDHDAVLSRSSPAIVVALFFSLLSISWILARYVNINTFSLHGMYRDRLVRAYLGASNPKRKANKFTGFARDDDFAVNELDPCQKPLHVLNLTLNLVATNRLAWQQRKAQTFTVSPLHCGNFELGYRPAAHYGGKGGISLGTAAAISGAAASPNMGYRSAPATGFIMTLLNARLGSWLGNPGAAGARTWQHEGPRSAVRSLVKEALGLTSNQNEYVYLSDGGHFENLGLYEMVLRRCRRIVVLDSGCDPEFAFDDLGNALRKIRIDLGIPITFEDGSMQRLRARHSRCALAAIRYSAADQGAPDGWLLYVKPMLLGSEPPDVANYGCSHPDFPHQSTNNQWFDESQTESYRMLGLTTLEEICGGWNGGSLDDLHRHVARVYLNPCKPTSTETS